jgi:hypothetical protein
MATRQMRTFLAQRYASGCDYWDGVRLHLLLSPLRCEERSGNRGSGGTIMMRKTVKGPRCSNGTRCVAYPALGEPSKLSRGNPGPRCFACEERRVASELKLKPAAANDQKGAAELRRANQPPRARSRGPKEQIARERAEAERAWGVLELRRRSVLTCEGGLRSALASGDERLVLRWSRSLREAEERLAWAEADLARAEEEEGVRSERAG